MMFFSISSCHLFQCKPTQHDERARLVTRTANINP